MIRRLLMTVAILLMVASESFSQQEPQFTQFMFNKLPINSAYTGGRDVLTIRALYRNQWVGIEGHPQTATFSIHSPLKNEDLAIGFNVIHDRLGVTEQTWVNGTYAYRMPFGSKQNIRLAFGVNAGILYYTNALTTLVANDKEDIALAEDIKRVMPDVGAGMYLDGDNFYVGLSVPNFIPFDLYNKDQEKQVVDEQRYENARRLPHIMLMAGGVIPLGDNLKLRPQGLFKHVVGIGKYKSPYSIDFNLSLMIMDRVNVGGTYRTTFANKSLGLENQNSVDVMAEIWPLEQLMIGYAYDFDLTKLGNHHTGTHEITLGFDFRFKKEAILTPRYF